jgi:ferredoxin
MRVHVVADRCQGHNRCKLFAPATFVIDDLGYSSVPPEMQDVAEHLEEAVSRAAQNCPERAIVVEPTEPGP